MIKLKLFVFNPFQVNTYVLYNENQALIIDPGCYHQEEKEALSRFIESNQLLPVGLLNTHAHLDHILGNTYISRKYGLSPLMHADGMAYLEHAEQYAAMFGLVPDEIIMPDKFLLPGEEISFGKARLKALYTPGHADGSLCFHAVDQGFVITGDLIFYESIGRTDLPGGDYNVLADSIYREIFTLDDAVILYPGHGHETNVKHEKQHNPFVSLR